MLWKEVLHNWENGIPLKYPKQLNSRFQWNTSVLKNNGNIEFKQSFKTDYNLPTIQNKKEFQEYILKSKNKYVVAFPNLSGDTILVIPIPVHGKNYATLRDFIDNAPLIQQQAFWKKVANIAKGSELNGDVWISVHGLGVAYTHVRISHTPKYYFDDKFIKDV